jgi:hypothetical protein
VVRRDLWIPLAVVSLTVAFVFVSFLVRLCRGHPWLIRRKLRLGAVLLGLTWAAAGCDESGPGGAGGGGVTCYMPAPTDDIMIDDRFRTDSGYVLDLNVEHVLTGEVRYRTTVSYAFQLLLNEHTVFLRGNLVAADGAFDESTEAFLMDLGTELPPTSYELRIYAGSVEEGRILASVPLSVMAGT